MLKEWPVTDCTANIDVPKQCILHADLILKCQVDFKHLNVLGYLYITWRCVVAIKFVQMYTNRNATVGILIYA